jgi:hypothetical protein
MGWLLSNLKKLLGSLGCRGTEKTRVGIEYTLYTREKGPICYSFPLFPWRTSRDTFFQQLFTSSLRWFWESARGYDPSPASAGLGLPKKRALTALTESNTNEFIRDLEERDLNDDMRFIALYGVDPKACPGSSLRVWLHDALQDFLRWEQGPLWLVVIQVGDCNDELVFVTHTPPAPVQTLLQAWRVADRAPRWVRPYRALGVVKLEDASLPLN